MRLLPRYNGRVDVTIPGALSNLGREALRIVLSSPCVVCGRELPWRERTASCCGLCWSALPRIDGASCVSCALPLPAGTAPESVCLHCSIDPLPLEWCAAWGVYGAGLDAIMQAFKFRRHDFLDVPLAGLLKETMERRGDFEFDAVAAVPMHRLALRRRGYNQAELLARALARLTCLRFESALLEKTADNRTQSTLARPERAANVRQVYRASQRAGGRSILIVDDICTTGETLRASALALLHSGASRVCAITVAKAV